MSRVDVSFITVNYFSADFTERWIKSVLRETKGVTYEILIVDNGSGLDSDTLLEKYPTARVFYSPTNLGYGAALHKATAYAQGTYLYFLNNDTELTNDAGAIQAQFLNAHGNVGLTGAQLIDPTGRRALSFDYFPTLLSKLVGTGLLRRLQPGSYPDRNQDLKAPLEVDLVSGASLFISAILYKRLGGFDPEFFLYCEEEDLALRVHQAGYKVFIVPAARVQHTGGASSRDAFLLKKEFYISFFKFYQKHYGPAKAHMLKLLCLNQFLWRAFSRKDAAVWRRLLSWGLRGSPLSDSLREQPKNRLTQNPLQEIVRKVPLLMAILALNRWSPLSAFGPSPNFDKGVLAYKEHLWTDAMGAFLEVLHEDPKNALAHKYMDAIAQEIALERRNQVQIKRLAYLQGASEALKARPNINLNSALTSLSGSDDQQKVDRWHEKLEESRMHKDLGQLLPANALIFQILSEKPDHQEALQELSDLQSRLRKTLDSGSLLVIEERYAYEGFYAYGQADYAAAATAWSKARSIVEQSATRDQRKIHLQALCFEPYVQIAQAHVDDEKQQGDLHALFSQGVSAYDQGHFEDALDLFRRLALKDPDYPQLAFYLVQAETGADKSRAKRLGEEKRQEILALYQKGVDQLEKENFDVAERAFTRVLSLDPTHSQARAYLAMAKAENQRRHDPKAAQMHYDAGLIAYASGKLDEAVREWNMAIRMNPDHPKARIALAKVEKELALSREVPDPQ